MQSAEVEVDLSEGRLHFRRQTVDLTRRLAALAAILVAAMPNTVAHEIVATKMWGDKEIDVFGNTKVAVSQLRKKLRPMGLNIAVNWGRGYRIEIAPKLLQTERTSLEAAHAQA